MPELIAIKPLKYPHAIAVGERFMVTDSAARVLKMSGKARDANVGGYATRQIDAEQSDDVPQVAPRQKRKYQRRDMLAQD